MADGVTVVDDYAHNAGKVRAVVSTARALVDDPHRLIVIFQPHLYSRTADFARELGEGLAPADEVLVMDIYAAREDPIPGVTGELVAQAVADAPGFSAHVQYVPTAAEAAEQTVALARPGDLVLTVGAGDVTGLGPQLLALLGQREQGQEQGAEHGQERQRP
ncbi:glutamate ligase domain-containing protein [Arsenicicoccus piscis]|uniref:Mur ligase C-terminal domain-containing protein n=1 Tax=Arsenicicoccus piscis TaxID=673954 RepID=A0ABQ6HKG6_9MICO|nr:hypothetical protein GCM10025862_09720 [Arsenicicoccus piscis]